MASDISRRNVLLSGVGAGVAGAAAASSAAAAPSEAMLKAEVRVTEFMSAEQLLDLASDLPTIDSSAAFRSAWEAVRQRGGVLELPPGNYLLATPWQCDVTGPASIKISGWGARLFAGSAIDGFAMQVRGSFNEYMLDIEGLAFDHRGNGGVHGAIEVLGGHCVRISRCVLEYAAVRRDYRFIRFAANPIPLRRGEDRDEYNSFWCKVEGCSIRRRSSKEPGLVAAFVQVVGAANSLSIVDNCIQHCAVGVSFEPDPETSDLANGVVLDRNAFEAITEVGVRVTIAPGAYGPAGLRIVHNRFEVVPAAFEVVGGASAKIHSQPPLLFGNYYINGSVDAVVRNSSQYPVSVFETRMPGYGPTMDNTFYMSGNLRLKFGEGQNLRFGDHDAPPGD